MGSQRIGGSARRRARGGELWPVAQAVVELLGRDSAERTALMSLLGTRGDLENRAQRWAESHPKVEARVEVMQGMLWKMEDRYNDEP